MSAVLENIQNKIYGEYRKRGLTDEASKSHARIAVDLLLEHLSMEEESSKTICVLMPGSEIKLWCDSGGVDGKIQGLLMDGPEGIHLRYQVAYWNGGKLEVDRFDACFVSPKVGKTIARNVGFKPSAVIDREAFFKT